MAFPPDEAKLVSIFIQTLLYGAYTVVFILTVWVLLSKRPQRQPAQDPMLWITVLMFLMATLHIGINYTRVIKAFIIYRNAPGGPAAFFNQLSEFTQIFGSTVYVAQTLIGDSVVLYRCYLVWGRLYVVIVPFILLLGSTASGIGILYSFAKVVPEAEIFVDELQHWILSFFSLTLATNIICTGGHRYVLFCYRPIVFLVLESGMVYSATLLTLLILYKTGSWFQYVLLDAISPIVGLVFSMIIVRIGLGITSINGTSAYNTTDTISRTAGSGREADRQVGITSKSAFQRIRLQFAPPSHTSDLPDAELALHDLNLRQESSLRSEEVLAKQQSKGTPMPGVICLND
uniref:Cell surface hydrophobicity-associated protein n=1 Tax=Ganoderma boninense TaxID=34458 RepID=A0A5K1JXK9_9APHY